VHWEIPYLPAKNPFYPPNQELLESLVLVVGEVVTKLAVSRIIRMVFTGVSRF
jgi:hypothetical protein